AANLVGVAEAPRADLLLEALDLAGGEVSRVAPVMQGAEGIKAAVAGQAQLLDDLPHAPAEQVSDFVTGHAVDGSEHRGEALVDGPVVGLVAAALEFLALLRGQMNRLHDVPTWAGAGPL